MEQIQKEIDSFYAKYATSEGISIAEAKRRVSKLDIEEYSRKAEKYVRDKTFTKKANEEMRLYNATMRINRLEMLKANIGLETVAAQSDVEKYLDEILEGRTREEIKHQSGILGESVNTNTDKAIAAIVNGSFRNSKYTAKWSDTLWKNQTLLKSELDRLITKGLTQGKSSRALASELRKSINAEKSVAERLMRTELARVTIESGLSLMKENDYDEYIYMTLSFKDGKICDDCKALDGMHFKRNDAEVGFNLPPMHPNCRCSIAPYIDEKELQQGNTFGVRGNSEKVETNVVPVRDFDCNDTNAVIQMLKNVQMHFKNLDHEESIIITTDNTMWYAKSDGVTMPLGGITSSLKGAYAYHNHPSQKTNYSFGEEDVATFLSNRMKYSKASDDMYEYYMRRTAKTKDASFAEVYHKHKIMQNIDGLEAVIKKGGDPDFDKFHEILLILSKEYEFEYERTKIT